MSGAIDRTMDIPAELEKMIQAAAYRIEWMADE